MSQQTETSVTHLSCDEFLKISEKITGFSMFELQTTGMVDEYYEKVCGEFKGSEAMRKLRNWLTVELGSDGLIRESKANAEWIRDGCRIAELWYLGSWPGPPMRPDKNASAQRSGLATDGCGADEHPHPREVPGDCPEMNRAPAPPPAKPISAEAYVQSLVWKTFGGHPMGALPPGFGSWSLPPTDRRGV